MKVRWLEKAVGSPELGVGSQNNENATDYI